MQIIVGLVALGCLIALNFVKPSTAQGNMKLIIYGSRIVSIIIVVLLIKYYFERQNQKGHTAFGNSAEEFNKKSLIGEWGWSNFGVSGDDKVIYIFENGDFFTKKNNQLSSGKWDFDANENRLVLNNNEESEDYLVEGKKGKKLYLTKEEDRFLFSDEDIELVKRDKANFLSTYDEMPLNASSIIGEWNYRNPNEQTKFKIKYNEDGSILVENKLYGTWNFDESSNSIIETIENKTYTKRILSHNHKTILFDYGLTYFK